MSSAYGKIQRDVVTQVSLDLPITKTLKNGQSTVAIDRVHEHLQPSDPVFKTLYFIMNHIIEEGLTYPQENVLNETQFRDYFLSYDTFVATCVETNQVLGAFYVKPNYPGRCSHICNGGFIVHPEHRGLGVGKALAQSFLHVAPRLGYKSSVFNLVFENNEASVKIWRSLGFQEIGRIPKAGRLKGVPHLVDAIMFQYEFEVMTNQK